MAPQVPPVSTAELCHTLVFDISDVEGYESLRAKDHQAACSLACEITRIHKGKARSDPRARVSHPLPGCLAAHTLLKGTYSPILSLSLRCSLPRRCSAGASWCRAPSTCRRASPCPTTPGTPSRRTLASNSPTRRLTQRNSESGERCLLSRAASLPSLLSQRAVGGRPLIRCQRRQLIAPKSLKMPPHE